MVQTIKGAFVSCSDNSIKQIMLYLDNKMHFIIEDFDEKNLLIDQNAIEEVTESLNKILSENSYVKPEEEK